MYEYAHHHPQLRPQPASEANVSLVTSSIPCRKREKIILLDIVKEDNNR